jgi:hypothetical protein
MGSQGKEGRSRAGARACACSGGEGLRVSGGRGVAFLLLRLEAYNNFISSEASLPYSAHGLDLPLQQDWSAIERSQSRRDIDPKRSETCADVETIAWRRAGDISATCSAKSTSSGRFRIATWAGEVLLPANQRPPCRDREMRHLCRICRVNANVSASDVGWIERLRSLRKRCSPCRDRKPAEKPHDGVRLSTSRRRELPVDGNLSASRGLDGTTNLPVDGTFARKTISWLYY